MMIINGRKHKNIHSRKLITFLTSSSRILSSSRLATATRWWNFLQSPTTWSSEHGSTSSGRVRHHSFHHLQWRTRPERGPTVFPITNVAGGCKTLHQCASIIHVQVPNLDVIVPRRPHQPRSRRRRDKAHARNPNGVDVLEFPRIGMHMLDAFPPSSYCHDRQRQ